MGVVIPFIREFDATDMTIEKIREKARELGWPGIHIDGDEVARTGRCIVKRLSRRHVYPD